MPIGNSAKVVAGPKVLGPKLQILVVRPFRVVPHLVIASPDLSGRGNLQVPPPRLLRRPDAIGALHGSSVGAGLVPARPVPTHLAGIDPATTPLLRSDELGCGSLQF